MHRSYKLMFRKTINNINAVLCTVQYYNYDDKISSHQANIPD